MQDVLDEYSEEPLGVLVVWEPVLASDIAPPTTGTLALIHDPRASQYWDEDRHLSADLVRALMASPRRYGTEDREIDTDTVIWDAVAVFPRGAQWGSDLPVPAFMDYPVVRAVNGLRRTLARQLDVRPEAKDGP